MIRSRAVTGMPEYGPMARGPHPGTNMTKIFSQARIGLLCATAAMLATGVPARAEEGVAIKNLLGNIGIIPAEKDPIRYRERAPLVIPPKMELREPAGPESFASNNPQWPKDPDLVSKRRAAAERARPVTESEIRRMSEVNPRLTIYEMREGRNPNGGGPAPYVSDQERVRVSPAELASTRIAVDKSDDTQIRRRTLTDPPTAFRQPARGGQVASTYEARVDQQTLDANPINWLTRKLTGGDDDE